MALRTLEAFGRGPRKSLVHLLNVFLQALLDVIFKRRKLNSHAHSRVTGAHYRRNPDFFRIEPERNDDLGIHRQWRECFYITASPAYISCAALHVSAARVLKADFHR